MNTGSRGPWPRVTEHVYSAAQIKAMREMLGAMEANKCVICGAALGGTGDTPLRCKSCLDSAVAKVSKTTSDRPVIERIAAALERLAVAAERMAERKG